MKALTTEDRALRHLARKEADGHRTCELVDDRDTRTRPCQGKPAAVKLEDGFSDVVCEPHGVRAEERGAAVVWVTDRPGS